MTLESSPPITVVGAGLAGSECAFQLARMGHRVILREQKPEKRSPAHQSPSFAELVCSNSLRSDNPQSAVGLLHAELRRVGSLILSAADTHRVPAGDALAVDREHFSAEIHKQLEGQGSITIMPGEVSQVPDGLVVFVFRKHVILSSHRGPSASRTQLEVSKGQFLVLVLVLMLMCAFVCSFFGFDLMRTGPL